MKIDRNGKAKLNPKMAVNSANHSAARLRRQSMAAVVLLASVGVEQVEDAVGSHRQAIDHRVRAALA